MQIAYSPEITNRNIALVLLWTGTFKAFKPLTKLLNLVSAFHSSLRPASIELNGPARIGSSKATRPLNFGFATSSQLLGKSAGLIFLVLQERAWICSLTVASVGSWRTKTLF